MAKGNNVHRSNAGKKTKSILFRKCTLDVASQMYRRTCLIMALEGYFRFFTRIDFWIAVFFLSSFTFYPFCSCLFYLLGHFFSNTLYPYPSAQNKAYPSIWCESKGKGKINMSNLKIPCPPSYLFFFTFFFKSSAHHFTFFRNFDIQLVQKIYRFGMFNF